MDNDHARDPVTLREALGMFATKSDFLELRAELREGFKKLDAIVPREEHVLRAQLVDERIQGVKDVTNDLEPRVRKLESYVLPSWAATAISTIAAGVAIYMLVHH